MCWIILDVVRIYYFCSGHPFRPTTSGCECPTSLFKSTLLSNIDTTLFSLFPLCFRCTLLEYIFRSLPFLFLLTASPFPPCCYHNKHTHYALNMSSTDEISTNDKQFIIECLKNLDEDRLINLNKVAGTLGYSNVFSVGNRLRSLRNRYGFANFEGKTITGKTVAGEAAGAPAPAPAPPSKRGRPRVKNVAPTPKGDVFVEVTNKRKRDDDNNNGSNNNNNNEENNGDAPKKATRRGRKPASTATTTATDSEATTNGHGHVHGRGKTTSFRAVHFPRFQTPSKKCKKQVEMATTERRRLETPSRRIFRIAAQTIGRARSERRRLLDGETMRSGLKLVFKLQV